jgi:nicotinate-nucleotide adenylyltransferase
MPAGDPWRKAGRPISPASDRMEMVCLAIAGNDAFRLDRTEMDRAGATYTVDTLRALREILGLENDIYLILGEDAFADMPNWREPAEIARLAHLVLAPREEQGPDAPTSSQKMEIPAQRIEMPYIGISATAIRERVRMALSIRYQVPEAVEAYIREKRLYTSG